VNLPVMWNMDQEQKRGGAIFLGLNFEHMHSRRSGGNVGIAERFPRAVGRVENLLLVFQAFHSSSFPALFRCSLVKVTAQGPKAFEAGQLPTGRD